MRRIVLFVLFSSALLASSQSGALTLDFSGNVSGIFGPFSTTTFQRAGDLPPLTFGIGEQITGRLIWDDSVADSDPAADNGLYLNALTLMRVEIAGNAWEITGGTVQIIPEVTDPIQVYGIASGDSLDTFVADRFTIDFDDPTDYITADSLPNMGAMFQSMLLGGSFSLNFLEGGERTFEIEGGSFEFTNVPEPGAGVLVSMGLLLLSGCTKRRSNISDFLGKRVGE